MKPPATVKVGPHLYRVVLVPDGVLIDGGTAGHCATSRLVIAIEPELAPSQVCDTIIHECLHALLDGTDLDPDVEERVALCLAPGLLLLLESNPDLVAYITKG